MKNKILFIDEIDFDHYLYLFLNIKWKEIFQNIIINIVSKILNINSTFNL